MRVPVLVVWVLGLISAMFGLRWMLTLRSFESRRLLVGFVLRKLRWEFWPVWAAYLPLVPYLLYLAIRYRSPLLFTAANPGIPSGGLAGESKSEILRHLRANIDASGPSGIAEFQVVRNEHEARIALATMDLMFPVVLKPDVGERGSGVAVIRSEEELRRYFFRKGPCNYLLQRYIPGVEFGVFYVRHPEEARGRISSMTEKRFPMIRGDGRSSLWELILRDPRAVCMARTYRRLSRHSMQRIVDDGELVQLVELGSHCRGAIFNDGSALLTPELEAEIERISRRHPGFFLGRFDIRAATVEEFRAGRFWVIELNGVSAEPTHIYDPRVSLFDAYRAMFSQWRAAFAIGAVHRSRGVAPMKLGELWGILRRREPASSQPQGEALRLKKIA